VCAPTDNDRHLALAAARDALAQHDWQTAYDLAAEVDGGEAEQLHRAHRLALRAEAAWWLGRMDECIASREEAFAIYDDSEAARQAGQCAVWLYEHYCFKAQPNIGGAWLRRARQRLDGDAECAEYGNLVLREAEVAHGQGELAVAAARASTIVELGRRLRITDLEAEALQTLGRVLLDQGLTREGLERLDEAMLFAVEGRLGPYATGKVYCSLITACEELGDFRRAVEWTDATLRWSERHPFAVFPGLCRVHRACALERRGDWTQAEQEALLACGELREMSPAHAAAGFVELGDVRRMVGDLEAAEAAYSEAEALSGRPPPGLALVRLAQGRRDAATAIIVRALDGETWNRLARARLLPPRAQIAIACDDLEAATTAAAEFDAIAADLESPALLAAAATTRGRVHLASGDAADACVILRDALERWRHLDVPYEVATARVLLGQACRAVGDDDGAAGSFTAAAAVFEQLGAMLDARATRGLLQHSSRPGGLTEREADVLQLVASGRSNKDIANALFISERTVARHLSNIFTKIGVSSRSAATAYAFEHGLAGAPRGAG
jgi:DNA-binding NarL/FixJ family response regulator